MEELNCALWDAEEFINNNGVPLCDYALYRPLWKNNNVKLTPIEKFKNAVRRVRVLNQRNKTKTAKILELLDRIKGEMQFPNYPPESFRMKKPSLTLKPNSHVLVPFIKNAIVK